MRTHTNSEESIIVKVELDENKKKYKFTIENFVVKLEEKDLNSVWDSFYRGEKSRNK